MEKCNICNSQEFKTQIIFDGCYRKLYRCKKCQHKVVLILQDQSKIIFEQMDLFHGLDGY